MSLRPKVLLLAGAIRKNPEAVAEACTAIYDAMCEISALKDGGWIGSMCHELPPAERATLRKVLGRNGSRLADEMDCRA